MNITLKKAGTVCLTAFAFLSVCSLCAYVLRFLQLSAEVCVWVALGVLAVSGVCALFVSKVAALSMPVFLMSSVAMGFAIRAWYLFRGFDNPLWLMLLISLGATACLWLYWLLSHVPLFAEHSVAFSAVYVLLSLGAYLAVMLTTKTTYVSTLGYYMLIEVAFLVAMGKEWEDMGGFLRTLSVSTFSVFGLAAVAVSLIALAVLSGDGDFDADCCECVDCCDIGDVRAKRKKK